MRETLAKLFAALLTGLVVLMSAFFADRRNPAEVPAATAQVAPPPVPSAPVDPALVARGLVVYEEQSCARCHSIEGTGNPRVPLDEVGRRLGPDELRDGVLGAGAPGDALTRSVQRAKSGFSRLAGPDLDALVAYLGSLR